eukprot:Mycagemm_TRINITY_DN10289_c2_g11::TRINITY_DN10289_c2_g11_i1::g.3608::m.3608 type:complete len:167 gc:universal TRINITY_DN10289_c2_g11_i1:531-31(-)
MSQNQPQVGGELPPGGKPVPDVEAAITAMADVGIAPSRPRPSPPPSFRERARRWCGATKDDVIDWWKADSPAADRWKNWQILVLLILFLASSGVGGFYAVKCWQLPTNSTMNAVVACQMPFQAAGFTSAIAGNIYPNELRVGLFWLWLVALALLKCCFCCCCCGRK